MLVSEIHEHVDLVLGIKNIFELEGIVNFREFREFPLRKVILKPRVQRFIEMEAPFKEEISGLVIFKMLDKKAQSTLRIKLKFVRNTSTLDITNISLETVIFNPNEMLGIFYLRSMGYY